MGVPCCRPCCPPGATEQTAVPTGGLARTPSGWAPALGRAAGALGPQDPDVPARHGDLAGTPARAPHHPPGVLASPVSWAESQKLHLSVAQSPRFRRDLRRPRRRRRARFSLSGDRARRPAPPAPQLPAPWCAGRLSWALGPPLPPPTGCGRAAAPASPAAPSRTRRAGLPCPRGAAAPPVRRAGRAAQSSPGKRAPSTGHRGKGRAGQVGAVGSRAY